MTVRYSACHFAEVMGNDLKINKPYDSVRCSFCGEPCELVPEPSRLSWDLELTLRRWKDGDCSLDDMFNRVNEQLERSYRLAFNTARDTMQADKQPLYTLSMQTLEWEKALPDPPDRIQPDGGAEG